MKIKKMLAAGMIAVCLMTGCANPMVGKNPKVWIWPKIQTLKKSKLSHRYADKYGIVRKESLDFFLFTLQSFMIKLEVNKYEFIRIKQYI